MTTLTAVCLTHRHAPLALLERFPRHDELAPVLHALHRLPGVRGAFVLSTCNRFEVYLTSDRPLDPRDVVTTVSPHVSRPASAWTRLAAHYRDDTAVAHLFSVAAGLDSRLVGEPEILGQVRAGADASARAGCLDIELATLTQWAVRAGRRARRALGATGPRASVADQAVAVVDAMLPGLAGRRVVVLGAGHLAARAVQALTAAGATTIVCARDVDKARLVAPSASVVPIELLPLLVRCVDAVICATSAREPLLTAAMLDAVPPRQGRGPLVIVDLGVPRNVEAEVDLLSHVVCLDLDGLARRGDPGPGRAGDVAAARSTVEVEVAAYAAAQVERTLSDLLEQVTRNAERIREAEVRRVARRCNAGELAATDEVARRLVGKLLHPIVTGIKAAATSGDPHVARAAATILGGELVTVPRQDGRRTQAS